MPITPFHFGPGAALHALAPKHVSFLSFCAANVLIDVEPLYYMSTGQYPLHRFFHTYLGVSLIPVAITALFLAARWFAQRYWLPKLFAWRELGLAAVAVGAALGSYSHIVLDSLMHADITPFAPFDFGNSLWQAVPLDALHWACVAAAGLAIVVLGLRQRPPLRGGDKP